MGPLVSSILKNVHIPSQKTHSKINGEQWLKSGETKYYLGQKCVQVDNKKQMEGQGMKDEGAVGVR